MKPHRGTLILVLGIVSIFVCGIILGPIAWVMGNNDLREMSAGTMDPSGKRHDQRWQNLRNDCPVLEHRWDLHLRNYYDGRNWGRWYFSQIKCRILR